MRITHDGKEYELFELREPKKETTSDIIGIFEIITRQTDGLEYEDMRMVNFFYGSSLYTNEDIIEGAIQYIEMEKKQK